MTAIRWRIFYGDGATFDNTQGEPWEACKTGVQIIAVQHPEFGRRLLHLANFYVWSPTVGAWLDQEDATAAIMRLAREPWGVLLCGEYVDESLYTKIRAQAVADPDFRVGRQVKPAGV